MINAVPLLHEIIPHGWTRLGLVAPDATITSGYAENPGAAAVFRERFWRFMDDQSAPASLWAPSFRAVGIGWTLHLQGRGWLESGYYREIEAPLDSCWSLGAMIGDGGRTIGFVNLTLHAVRARLPWTMCGASIRCVPGSRTLSGGAHPVTHARRMRLQ